MTSGSLFGLFAAIYIMQSWSSLASSVRSTISIVAAFGVPCRLSFLTALVSFLTLAVWGDSDDLAPTACKGHEAKLQSSPMRMDTHSSCQPLELPY
jgi:hypothetical protein